MSHHEVRDSIFSEGGLGKDKLSEQIRQEIILFMKNNFNQYLLKGARILDAELAPRSEFDNVKERLANQVSQSNSIFMMVDKCERYCRDMDKEFQELRDSFSK